MGQRSAVPLKIGTLVPVCLLMFLTAVVLVGPLQAQSYAPQLSGLRRVSMAVQVVGLAIDSARAQTRVELRLRELGLRVVPTDSAQAHLAFLVILAGGGTGYVEAALYEPARLTRQPGVVTPVVSWSDSDFIFRREESDGALDALLDKFLNAWLAANPRGP